MNILTPNRGRIGQAVSNTFDKVLSAISGVWSVEHHDDGTHGDITADSLTLTPASVDHLGNVSGSLVPSSATDELGIDVPIPAAGSGAYLAWLALHVTTVYFETYRATGSAAIIARPRFTAAAYSNDQSGVDFVWTLKDVTGANTHTLTIGAGLSGLTSTRAIQGSFLYSTSDVQADTGYLERSRSTRMGEWTTFTPSRTASAGTWTGGTVNTARYMLVGKTLWVTFYITASSVSNAGVELRIAVPGGFTSANDQWALVHANDNGAGTVAGTCVVTAGGTILRFFATTAAGGFGIAAGTTDIKAVVALEVQ